MPSKGFDFAGYATRNNIRCTDGTIIRPGCFHNMDGKTVPLVYQHNHNSIGQVLGHCELEERPDGIYCYAYCNDTDAGRNAKEAVQHGDINAFSIWANNLRRNANDILHGAIREVSLVLSGADKTAVIDTIVSHGEESENEAEIQFLGGYADMMTDEEYYLAHADEYDDSDEDYFDHADEDDEPEDEDEDEDSDDGKTIEDVVNSMTKEQREVLNYMVGMALKKSKGSVAHADEDDEDMDSDTVEDVINSMSDKQRNVMNYVVGLAVEKANGSQNDEDEDEDEEDYSEEDDEMKHNAFEDYGDQFEIPGAVDYISHDELNDLINDSASFGGSLAKAFHNAVDNGYIAHDDTSAATYGVDNIEYLFPDARTLNAQPDFIKRNTDWVDKVLASVHRTPFARVKSIHADITGEEARARGYIKGDLKEEEVLTLLQRVTEPQTIYKKQKLDKDDIDDITGFDVIAWLKAEMQIMLREEIARAILIGDGRSTADRTHIKEDRIRPVVSDAELYTIKYAVEIPENATDSQKAKALLTAVLKARKLYKGTGTPTFYTNEDGLTNALLLENGIGERIYKSEAEVATAMRVGTVQTVEPMEGLKVGITESGTTTQYDVAGIAVNLADYNIGTNGGAKTDFFDDFDLNYNQQICLYETRLSGAMVKPYSAITFYYKTKAAA